MYGVNKANKNAEDWLGVKKSSKPIHIFTK